MGEKISKQNQTLKISNGHSKTKNTVSETKNSLNG